ncbi:integrase core domain-containing protein [Sulfitobacter sp. 1A13353]|uniref:integrase core domain-containing protein n=1 Tax=Sulfitobacter sp. 1A13353 TaxID=3368568 RepID=UPI003746A7E3
MQRHVRSLRKDAQTRLRARQTTTQCRNRFELIGEWIEDYNNNHPHSGLRWRSPREFIKATTETA